MDGSEFCAIPKLGLAALLAGAVCIGAAPIFVRLSDIGPSATAFYRLLLAQPLIWLWLGSRREASGWPLSFRPEEGGRLLILAGVFFALDMAAWHWSIRLTTVANSTLIANLAPLVVAVGSMIWFGDRPGRRLFVGMGVCFVGIAVLSGASWSRSAQHLIGDGMGLLTAVFYGIYQLMVKRLRKQFGVWMILAVSGLSATVALAIITGISESEWLPTTSRGWWAVIGLALVSQVFGQGLIIFGFAHLPAAFSSLVLLLQPVIAAFLAWWLLAEALDGWQALGGAIVLCGIVVARRRPSGSALKS